MKIKTITVTYEIRTNEEESRIYSLLALPGSSEDRKIDRGTKEPRSEVAYQPSNERTSSAVAALGKCQRVKLLNPSILEKWALAFPHVDLAGEIAKAEAWAESKNVHRTAKGWAKTLNTWLAKAQDKTRGDGTVQGIVRIPTTVKAEPEAQAWAEAAEQ